MLDLKIIQPNQLKKYKVAIARRAMTLESIIKKAKNYTKRISSKEYKSDTITRSNREKSNIALAP